MKKYYYFAGLGAVLLGLVFSSCKNVLGPSSSTPIVFPASNVSYTKQVQPLFDQKCNVPGCHDSQTQAGNPPLDLSDQNGYTSLITTPGIVVHGDTLDSELIESVEGRMPLMPPPLSGISALNQNQINGLKTWIMEGAKLN